jgi:archaellum biogenesis ATPase FlaH
MRSENRLTAARAYLAAGLKLIAIHGITTGGTCTCGKQDCSHKGKHPIAKYFPNGVLGATSDVSIIRKALNEFPDANIAAALGGLTVVDIDGPRGKAAFGRLDIPRTVKVKTSRGMHVYFIGEIPGGTTKGDQIDILTGENRYVMLPPSIHESGHRYSWLPSRTTTPAAMPDDLNQLAPAKKDTQPSTKKGRKSIPRGERNDVLFRVACAIRRRVNDDRIILDMMRILNDKGLEEPLSDTELRGAVASSGKYGEAVHDLFGPPVETEPLPMEYLWYPYIPRYGLTIIAGDPGRGKSMLTALLAATVTSKQKWPLSNERPSGKKVLLLSAEDNWARVTLHRLKKAGADISNIHVMYRFRALTPERLELLAEYIETERPDLVIIDTLSAYMGGARDMHRQNEVGEFLGMLTEIAERTGAAIVGLAHLNKQSNELPMYRIVGSIGFFASIRSALFLGTDPDDRTKLALAHGKANASERGQTIVFDMVGGGKEDVPVLVASHYSSATDQDVCRVDTNPVGRPSSEREAAIEFVLDFLSDKPTPWKKVQLAAEARSIASEGTLNTVRAELARSKKIVQVGRGKQAEWKRGKADRKPDEDNSI